MKAHTTATIRALAEGNRGGPTWEAADIGVRMAKVALELLVVVAVVAIGSLVVLPARAARAAVGLIRHNAAAGQITAH